ncbi:MAG: ATP-dependent DNA helicase RecQ [Deltaproteobacteria bacterium]|nr:ATP-dependent DNA helicase RecQ [Deltaproteobacteria bacterium]
MSSIAQKPHSTTDGTKLSDEALLAGLRKLGYERFRPGQLEAVRSLLDVGRLLLVAPTGGGKSLIYQLPGSLLAGTTVVISPLISLMQDQVTALNERGIAASYLASTLEPSELRRRMGEAGRGAYKLIYAAPERLTFPGFRSLLADLDCPLVAVDEAHCISQWGHDFRPEYLQIGEMLKDLPRARALACTATATPVVRDEILERLGLDADTPQILRGFARPNLALRAREVKSKRERETNVDAVLEETLGAPGDGRGAAIVYTPTRKSSEEEARRLLNAGWRAAAYHAGLSGAARDAVQSAFADGKTEVVTATNAFGLLVNPGDMPLRRHLIESDVEGRSVDLETVRHKWNVFLELMRWAEGGSCRHDAILRYFGDEEETLEGCGRCDVCRDLDDNERADPEHVTEVVRKALSAVARIHGRFGIAAAAKLLRGEPDPRLVNSGLDRTRTFGILAERSEDWLLRLLRRCVTAGWVDFSGGDRPVVVLTEDGTAVMRGTRPARLLLPSDRRAPLHAGAGDPRTRRSADSVPSDELDAAAAGVFEALRGYRREVAHREGVPPYVVASDRSLRDLARLRPRSPAELQFAHGIGPAKAEKYGAELLAVIRRAEPTDAPPAVPPSNPEVQ